MRTQYSLFITMLVVGAAILSGCEDNRPRQSGPRQAIQNFDEKKEGQLRSITGRDAADKNAPQEDEAQLEGNEVAQEGTAEETRISPLQAAADRLNEKEIIDARAKPPVEPAEVQEALKPLVKEHWARLHPGYEVWLDKSENQVIVGGQITLRNGPLEMFACPAGTKEHESVISTFSNAEIVHIGLLAAGAIPGVPAYWTEETGMVTAIGPKCEITIAWPDGESTKQIDAREFVVDREGQPLSHEWVFCGSRVWIDPDDANYREYQADGGDMICVSNFPTAMLDLNVKSSNSDSMRVYSANPDKVPALGHPVLIFIKPDVSSNLSEETLAAAKAAQAEAERKMVEAIEARMKEREKRLKAQEEKEKQALEKSEPTAESMSTPESEPESKPDKNSDKTEADNSNG